MVNMPKRLGLVVPVLLALTVPRVALADAQPGFAGVGSSNAAMTALSRLSNAVQYNNPRVNPVMSNPPTIAAAHLWTATTAYTLNQYAVNGTNRYIVTTGGTSAGSGGPTGTGTGIADGSVVWNFVDNLGTASFSNAGTNSYLWNAGAGAKKEVFNYYGGVRVDAPGSSHYAKMQSVTVAGTLTGQTARYEWVADSAKFTIRIFGTDSAGQNRLIINNQYASLTPTTPPHSGFNYLVVDFSAVGGRAKRTVALETGTGATTYFGGVDVGATEGIYKPQDGTTLRMIVTGDSYLAGGGVTDLADGLQAVAGDMLGAKDVCGTALGSTGLIVSDPSGTALSRVADVTNCANQSDKRLPVILMGLGTNDSASTSAAITAAAVAYVQAIRAVAVTRSTPIFMLGIWPHNSSGATRTTYGTIETALSAAATTLNDPLVFFIPIINDPNGAWQTGSGDTGNLVGDGNSDLFINSVDHTHPNAAGHIFLGGLVAGAIRRATAKAGY